MGVMFKKGHVMCQDHYKCPHESCPHHDWHKPKTSCKARVCTKTEQNVRFVATPRKIKILL